jgi:hypothetical protein
VEQAATDWGITYPNIRVQDAEPATRLLTVKPLSKSAHHPCRNLLPSVLHRREHTRSGIAPFFTEAAITCPHDHGLPYRLDCRIYFLVASAAIRKRRCKAPISDPAIARQVPTPIDGFAPNVVIYREFPSPGGAVGAPAGNFFGRCYFAKDEGGWVEVLCSRHGSTNVRIQLRLRSLVIRFFCSGSYSDVQFVPYISQNHYFLTDRLNIMV